jgi:PAS domain S-box-containing protein
MDMTNPSSNLGSSEWMDSAVIFEFCPEMLAIITNDARFLQTSASSARIVGHTSAQLAETSFYDLVHPDDLELATNLFEIALRSADRVSLRCRSRARSGHYRWIEWSLFRPCNAMQVYAVAREVTDHSTAEKELARANEILSTVLLSAPLPIWASDPDGRIQFWNQAAERTLGWTSEEILQGAPPDLLPKCSQSQAINRLSGEKRSWRRKDGSSRDLRLWTAPLHESGVECGTLGMAVDVTEHDAEVYNALQQAYDDLRDTREAVMQHERLRVLGQMASGIAHDINNALAPVKLYAQVLIEDERGMSERGRDNLRTIRDAIDDVTETVERLREFYRSRESQLKLLPLNLNELVRQVIELARARWRDMPQESGITIDVVTELSDDLPPAVGIESEIREALINLIFNAVDAMPSGGTLKLRTGVTQSELMTEEQPRGRQSYIEVIDTGVGMDENTRRRCLEPFFTTKGERGTGLGLAMVYGIVKRNNAGIEIESAPGRGTTVSLRFPVAHAADPQLHPTAITDTVPPLRILVIDDDPLVAEVLRDTLERDGHAVTVAEGGAKGLSAFLDARAKGESFAVVLTDLGMPYMDGRRVASAVKAESPTTPVILLTGWGRRMVADGDIPSSVDQVLSKPPDLSHLRRALTSCYTTSGGGACGVVTP